MKGSNKSSTKNSNDTNGLSQAIISKLVLDLGNNDIPDTAKLVRSDEVDRLSKLSKEEILEEYLKIFDSQQDLCIRCKYLKKLESLNQVELIKITKPEQKKLTSVKVGILVLLMI